MNFKEIFNSFKSNEMGVFYDVLYDFRNRVYNSGWDIFLGISYDLNWFY